MLDFTILNSSLIILFCLFFVHLFRSLFSSWKCRKQSKIERNSSNALLKEDNGSQNELKYEKSFKFFFSVPTIFSENFLQNLPVFSYFITLLQIFSRTVEFCLNLFSESQNFSRFSSQSAIWWIRFGIKI